MNIRKGTRNDLPATFDLVKELALFEKSPASVTTDINHYYACYEDGVFDFLVAEEEGVIIGMALFYITFSTWRGKMMYLEDFYVKPEFRSSGIGQRLFDEFIQTSKSAGCKQVKWQVLDWNDGAVRFYEKNGAIIEKEWWNGKIIF